jgi:hypothetical protein
LAERLLNWRDAKIRKGTRDRGQVPREIAENLRRGSLFLPWIRIYFFGSGGIFKKGTPNSVSCKAFPSES